MDRHRWLVLSCVSVGTFMSTLDGSIVNIALPQIADGFGIGIETVNWVVVAYLLVQGSLLLAMGRLGEVVSFKRVYIAGFAIFTAASVLCGLAPSALTLVLFRAGQAVGGAMMQAMGPAIIARTFGPGERGRALGISAVSVSLGLSLGPVLGGFLTDIGTWRLIFLVNLPVGFFAVAWASRILPLDAPGRRQPFDLPGAALAGSALFALLLALSQGQAWGWSSPAILALAAAFLVLGTLFIVRERVTAIPMLDLGLFRSRAFSAGLLAVVVLFAGLFTATFLLPFLLERSAGFTPFESGLLLTPIPIVTAFVAPFSGTLSDRIGSRLPATLGAALMVLGLASLTTLRPGFAAGDLVWRLAVIGLGQGLFMSPNTSAVLGAIPRPRIGTASGTIAQARITGQSLGIAASAAIVAARAPFHLAGLGGAGGPAEEAAAFAMAIHDAFAVAALICILGVVASMVRGPRVEAEGPEAALPA